MMFLDDRAADRQPNTHPADLGGVEGLEEPPKILRIDADASVLDAEAHAIISISLGTDQKLPGSVLNTYHCVRSIAEQVEGNLL